MIVDATLAIDGGTPVRRDPLPLIRACAGQEELREVLEVFEAGVFGSAYPTATKVRGLEKAFAEYVGAKHALAFSSGTTAQHASLAAIGIGEGDEVIVPPLTFISTAYTVLIRGGTVVFADVADATINLDVEEVRRKITPRTRAVVPVHWFGRPVDMDPLLALARQHDLVVIEDCAHAQATTYRGRHVGTMGAMACWSLQESKLITAGGEGGVLTTDDDELAEAARMMRDHGKGRAEPADGGAAGGYRVVSVGNNYRMTEMQGAFALAQLGKVGELNAKRQAHTERLDAGLGGIAGLVRPADPADGELSYPYYPIRFQMGCFRVGLDRISAALTAEGVGNYDIARDEMCHVQPVFADRSGTKGQTYGPGTLPVAERIADELLILPMYPDLTRRDLDDTIAAVRKVAAAYSP